MHCKHCGFVNGEDDHRCLRCGRRLSGVVIAAPPGYSGANALAPALVLDNETGEFRPAPSAPPASTAEAQPGLFSVSLFNNAAVPSQNVIPFDRREREGSRLAAAQPVPRVAVRKPAVAKVDTQGSLDFVPAPASKARKLKTNVEAQVFCGQPVATPTHRAVAAAIDGAIILIGFGLLLGLFHLMGGNLGQGKSLWIAVGAVLALVAMLYGLIWAIAGRETAGMMFTDLQLITFDGFPLDGRSRALRLASTWLSFCSGGLGLVWAVADEENLTWHDHISKTFPTIREIPGTFVKQRR
ncbi:MAG TPA: RDD family protein [Bryobacteraceae bacterium]|nr:RDD family protein [Bryobacteraceae bacterium]